MIPASGASSGGSQPVTQARLFPGAVTCPLFLRASALCAYGSALHSEDSPSPETVCETSISLLPFLACTHRIARFQKKSSVKVTVFLGAEEFYLYCLHIKSKYVLCNVNNFKIPAALESYLVKPCVPFVLAAVCLEPGITLQVPDHPGGIHLETRGHGLGMQRPAGDGGEAVVHAFEHLVSHKAGPKPSGRSKRKK